MAIERFSLSGEERMTMLLFKINSNDSDELATDIDMGDLEFVFGYLTVSSRGNSRLSNICRRPRRAGRDASVGICRSDVAGALGNFEKGIR